MKATFPLTWKILLVALLNVVVLAAVAVAFVQYELGQEFTSALLGPGRDRAVAVARQIALDLNETNAAERDAVLDRYRRDYGVTFLLFDNDGGKLAGPLLDVPAAVMRRLTERPRFPPDGPGMDESRGRGDRPPPPPGAPRAVPPMPMTPPFLVTVDDPVSYWVGVRIPVRARDVDETVRGTVLIASSTILGNPLYFQPLPWLAIVATTLVVTALCWIPLVRGATRSIAEMTQATDDIAAGRFAVPAPRPRRDELGVLAAAIASMAGRLHALVSGQKRFLRDAAHELRSPLGRMSMSLGTLERESPPGVKHCAADLREEIEVMTRLTDDLLAFGRSEMVAGERRLVPVNVRGVAERAARVEAGTADIRVDIPSALQVHADPDLLLRALSNLLRNAVTYAGATGPITISASDDAAVRIAVADAGPGVVEADLERLFLPFYRSEDSRDRRSGGAGLGLAIVRSAVEACGGTVSCRNLTPSGFEVSIVLRHG
jgi:signal transduction histidine kinase